MKKIIIIFLLFALNLFSEWKIEKTDLVNYLTKKSTDNKATLYISYGKGDNGAIIYIKSDKEIKEDAKISVEYEYLNYLKMKKKKDEEYYKLTKNNIILNYRYSDINFHGHFMFAIKLTVYVNKKKFCVFDLEDLNKLL